jgi:hypothetical protein
MARIRSIHPGFWTDETLAALSDAAALFYIGLLNEADDSGIFEWKPLTLRMRLRPTKDGSVETLLAELADRNVICRYEIDGRHYGAVRNFCRYQKPKFPKAVHPMTDAVRRFVRSPEAAPGIGGDDHGLFPPPAEAGGGDGAAVPRNAAGAAQREGEEGVDAESGEKKESLRGRRTVRAGVRAMAAGPLPAPPLAAPSALEAECRAAAGLEDADDPLLADLSPILTLIEQGYDFSRDVLPKLRAARAAGKRGRTWAYYVPAIVEGKSANDRIARKAPAPPVAPMTWVLRDGALWARHAARYRAAHGRDPPRVAGLGGMGWHFPAEEDAAESGADPPPG